MARGITQTDVWQAADALLLEGARPTIERVRQKIGSGSPNTVSPYLETWFKHLGGRIKDPAAFAAPSDVPDPVLAVAKHLWESAQAEARRDVEHQVNERMRVAVANVEAEKERTAEAERAAFSAVAQATRQASALEQRASELEAARLAHARTQAALEGATQTVEHLQRQLAEVLAKAELERAQTRTSVERADERAAGAERRAALHIEAERTARAQADERALVATRRTESLQSELMANATAYQQALGSQAAESAQLKAELTQLRSTSEQLGQRVNSQDAELHRLQALVQAASAQRELAETVISAVRKRGAARRKESTP
jgi:hypothetical protein